MTRTVDCDLSTATWQKSSYSDGSGGDCLEVAHDLPGAATWRKSTHSGGDGGNCLEVADHFPGIVPVRDSKNPGGPALVFRASAWAAFVTNLTNP
ncbi:MULTISPECIES: DUF397 domain-containing protein [unclassified Streptomyces]|uniref:DUF397 domain-containing protein n=1 Tax=unclassified Streptomyces TaxID=2593676 RepID=UPI002E0E9566|nr:DUF397 domain-containing protein [Streptomyces sp. NBC_01197]WSS49987.1 DUF397 domain-containing protein [Streptomyces sp. NBC_01180]